MKIGFNVNRWGLLQRQEESVQNSGVVTLTGADTLIVDGSSFTPNVGDRVLVEFSLVVTKGATSGETRWTVGNDGGSGTLQHILAENIATNLVENHLVTFTHRVSGMYIFQVVGAGTIIVGLRGLSAGSNATVAANDGKLHWMWLRG